MRAIPLVLAALVVAAIPAHALNRIDVSSSIAVNTTWGPTAVPPGDVYVVHGSIAVNAAATLFIQPGTVVKFDPSVQFVINGRLRAVGTSADSVVFTSIKDDNNRAGDTNGDANTTQPANSDWYGISFPDASPDNSSFYYADIRYAGAGAGGALTFVSASDSVVNSVIRRSYYGVDCQGTAAPTLVNTSIEASTLTPIVLDFTATPVLSSLVFSSSNNGYDAFGLRGGTLTGIATLPQRGATVGINPISNVTYVLLGSLTINASAGLTISPGVVIKPISGATLTVNGNLTMTGGAAPSDNITITSIHDDNYGLPNDTNNNGSGSAPNRGDWGRLDFRVGSTGTLSNCRLKFGTNSTSNGVVEMTNVSIPVSNSLISDAGHGVTLHGSAAPVLTSIAINNCSSTPILMSVSCTPTFNSLTFLANSITALGIIGETIAVNSALPVRNVAGYNNITYYMSGTITMQSPAVLTISPTVVLKFAFYTGIIVDGGLIADASPGSEIVFTSLYDDQYGNPLDTNGDGSSTTPASSQWAYLRFNPTADDPNCLVDYCRLTYGSSDGGSTSGPIWATSSAPTITNCTISKGNWGIRIDGNATPTVDHCDFNNLTAGPFLISALSDPVLTNNTFSTNGYNAIGLLSETLSQSTTLRYRPSVGPPSYPPFAYLPTGTITVASGVTLGIEPQVVIKPSSSFTVFSVNGALNIVGSNGTTRRVVFTSRRDDNPAYGGDTTPGDATTPQAGDWGNLLFNDISVDAACVLRNCLFQFGGAGGQDNGVLETSSANPRFVHLEFFQNVTAMTFKATSAPVVDSSTILNCTQVPIAFSLISNPVFPHPALIVLANNQYTALGILGETIAQDVLTRVRPLGLSNNMDYVPTGNITIAFGAKWTIAPGVVIKMGRVFSDPFGNAITIDGALVADGKPDSLIVFTSSADDAFGGDVRLDGALTTPAAGNWGYIHFTGVSNDAATILDYCRFRYAGYGSGGPLWFTNAGPTITNCVSTLTSGPGTYIEGNSTPVFVNCNIDSSTGVPVQMSLASNPTFTNVQFLGNTYTALGLIGESIAQDLRWPIRAVSGRNNMPYFLQNATLTIGLGATLTMQPGVIVKLQASTITIQRAFQAEGRAVEPESLVVFTSYRDDFYGGDSNNDGGVSVPTAGDWNYITIDGTAIDPEVRFKNCVLRYGGSGSTQGVIRAVNSSPTIDSCLIARNSVGLSAEGASNPRVHESSLYGNTYYAINNSGNSFCLDADSCWWGAANGPNDASATADLCGLGTNAGSGDIVSNNVDYTPFKTSGIVNPLIGDVSLNGQVLAYDASLVFQALVSIITLSPLQDQVADVTGTGGVSGLDGITILQFVAGIIRAFPAVSNGAIEAPPDVLAAREQLQRASGEFAVTLGEPRRAGDAWEVPVIASGSAPVYSVEVRLEGGAAATLADVAVTDAGRAIEAHNVVDGRALLAMGSATPLTTGEVAVLRFPAGDGEWVAPRLAWARANETVVLAPGTPRPLAPAISFLGALAPNPARGPVGLSLGLAAAQGGAPVSVRVLDLAGRTVRTLVDGPLAAGVHPLTWDLRDGGGRAAGAGLYFVHARGAGFAATRRLIVVR